MEPDTKKTLTGDVIGEFVISQYDRLDQKFKPNKRSDGCQEWTVLAAIVGIDRDLNLKLICLTTGCKATPDIELNRSHGKILHDCHAEVLALRAFNTVLLQEMVQMSNGLMSELLIATCRDNNNTLRYKFNRKWKLALYVSKLPCGDASMDTMQDSPPNYTNESVVNDKLINMKDDDPIQYINSDVKHILRGRFNYSKKGYVRTKPGRMDSKITLSKSCSDKLAMKQVTSILNSMTWSLLEEPVYLDYLVIPHIEDSVVGSSLKRCFQQRLVDSIHPVHTLQILGCNVPFPDDVSAEKQPSATSYIKLHYSGGMEPVEQVILNGLKNGFYTKPSKPLRKNCHSVVSRWAQFNLYRQLVPGNTMPQSYSAIKRSVQDRVILIEDTRGLLTEGDPWIPTNSTDDFTIE